MSETRKSDNVDLAVLIKLLGMTTSSNDGEALTAMRMANRHVTDKLKTTWDDILRSRVTVMADPFMSAPVINPVSRGQGGYTPNRPRPQYAPQPTPQPVRTPPNAFSQSWTKQAPPPPPRPQPQPQAAARPASSQTRRPARRKGKASLADVASYFE